MKRFGVRLLFIAFAFGLLAGCNSIRESSRTNELQNVLNTFQSTLRWGELSKLETFLSPELKKEAEKNPTNYDNIRITQYRVLQPPVMDEESNTAIAKVRISYVLRDQQVERSVTDVQHWAMNEEKKEWRRTNPLPVFK